jgi:hypothetical protein
MDNRRRNLLMNARLVAYYSLTIGLLMVLQWGFFLATGNVPELETEPVAIAFHLVAELVTATMLVVAGVGLLRLMTWSLWVALLSFGMLLYTSINSAGYFAEHGEWGMVTMFAVLFLLTLLCVWQFVKNADGYR